MATAGSREINVTPLIDVLLVLLIIFLVMMPIMLRVETVEIPPTVDGPVVTTEVTVLLKLQADLSISLDDGPLFAQHELAGRLRSKVANAKAVFVEFVDEVPWQEVISTVDTVRGVAIGTSRPELSVAVRLRTR